MLVAELLRRKRDGGELAAADTPVYLGRPGSAPLTTTLGELLPLAFASGALAS